MRPGYRSPRRFAERMRAKRACKQTPPMFERNCSDNSLSVSVRGADSPALLELFRQTERTGSCCQDHLRRNLPSGPRCGGCQSWPRTSAGDIREERQRRLAADGERLLHRGRRQGSRWAGIGARPFPGRQGPAGTRSYALVMTDPRRAAGPVAARTSDGTEIARDLQRVWSSRTGCLADIPDRRDTACRRGRRRRPCRRADCRWKTPKHGRRGQNGFAAFLKDGPHGAIWARARPGTICASIAIA